MNQIIYQFCYHNYTNEFEMLSRIRNTLKNYKTEMMDLEDCFYNFDFLNKEKIVVLVDIVPSFLNPHISKFSFNDFRTENEMMDAITKVTMNFFQENWDPEETLVIQLIHKIDNYL